MSVLKDEQVLRVLLAGATSWFCELVLRAGLASWFCESVLLVDLTSRSYEYKRFKLSPTRKLGAISLYAGQTIRCILSVCYTLYSLLLNSRH